MSLLESIQDYKGYSYKQKVINDCHKIILESKKNLNPIALAESALVTVQDNNEILQIGSSVPNDLLMDNFIVFMKEYLGRISDAKILDSMTDETNTVQSMNLRDGAGGASTETMHGGVTSSVSVGFTSLQFGGGSTPPTRQDFNVATPLATAPENAKFVSLNSGFNLVLSQISWSNSITAGGAGTINEVCMFMELQRDSDLTDLFFLMMRDLVSPSLAFIIGQSLAVDWVLQI